MNRKKKINSILKAKLKKINTKLHKPNKPRYISKAERAEMAATSSAEVEPVASAQPNGED